MQTHLRVLRLHQTCGPGMKPVSRARGTTARRQQLVHGRATPTRNTPAVVVEGMQECARAMAKPGRQGQGTSVSWGGLRLQHGAPGRRNGPGRALLWACFTDTFLPSGNSPVPGHDGTSAALKASNMEALQCVRNAWALGIPWLLCCARWMDGDMQHAVQQALPSHHSGAPGPGGEAAGGGAGEAAGGGAGEAGWWQAGAAKELSSF